MALIVPMRAEHTAMASALSADASPWSVESLQNELGNPHSCALVALCGNEVVGFVCAQMVCSEGAINNICVARALRGGGIATALLNAVIATAHKNDVTFFTLEVRESNTPAIVFYERRGFVRLGIRKGFYEHPPESAIIYRLDI